MRLRPLAFVALTGTLLVASHGFASNAQADQAIDACVFDLIGSSGDQFQLMQDYALQMRDHGVRFNLKPYTDEGVAMAEFSAGECDVLVATHMRTQRFNRFAGSIGAVGAIPSYKKLETAMAVLASPGAAKHMANDDYEVLGIFPAGAAFMFTTDRTMETADDMAGKRVATLDYMPDAIHMVNYVGASVEPSDITNFGGKFNNRSVDIAFAPGFAYEALELYRGIRNDGGVVRYPLSQITIQIVARAGVMDKELAQVSREVSFNMFGDVMEMVKRFEGDIPAEVWIDIPADDIDEYQEVFRQNRIQLRDGDDGNGNGVAKVYDGEMLTLLRRIRCRENPSASECTASDRE